MRPANNPLFSSPVSTSQNQFSLPQWSSFMVRCSFQLTVTGSNTGATGTVQLQASNDQATGLPANQFQPTNWFNVGAPVALTAIGNILLPEIECSYEYVRIAYFSLSAGIQTVALVADVSGSLNSSYFLLQDVNSAHLYYVWFNINSAGVDPAIAGRTAVPITGATNASAATLGASVASAVAALNSGLSFSTSGTSTVTINNLVSGSFVPASDGAAATHFTFAVTQPTGTLQGRIKSMNL